MQVILYKDVESKLYNNMHLALKTHKTRKIGYMHTVLTDLLSELRELREEGGGG